MNKKLSKHGNSLALVIDKPILELLGFDEGTELKIQIQDGSLIVTSTQKKAVRKPQFSNDPKMEKVIEKTLKKHSSAFKKLAKL